MNSAFYELIGRIVVQLGIRQILVRLAWLRYGRQIKIAGGAVALLTLAGGGYLLTRRQPPEG